MKPSCGVAVDHDHRGRPTSVALSAYSRQVSAPPVGGLQLSVRQPDGPSFQPGPARSPRRGACLDLARRLVACPDPARSRSARPDRAHRRAARPTPGVMARSGGALASARQAANDDPARSARDRTEPRAEPRVGLRTRRHRTRPGRSAPAGEPATLRVRVGGEPREVRSAPPRPPSSTTGP